MSKEKCAQDFVHSLRDGRYLSALEFKPFINTKYQKYNSEMGEDFLLDLGVYELSLTNIRAEDLAAIKFLDSFASFSAHENSLIDNKFSFITNAFTTALAVKQSLDIKHEITISNQKEFDHFFDIQSPFPKLILGSQPHLPDRSLYLAQDNQSGEYAGQYIQDMPHQAFLYFETDIHEAKKQGNCAIYFLPVAYRTLTHYRQNPPKFNKNQAFNAKVHQHLKIIADSAIACGDMDIFKTVFSMTYHENGKIKRYLDNNHDGSFFKKTAVRHETFLQFNVWLNQPITLEEYRTYAQARQLTPAQVGGLMLITEKLNKFPAIVKQLRKTNKSQIIPIYQAFNKNLHHLLYALLNGSMEAEEFAYQAEIVRQTANLEFREWPTFLAKIIAEIITFCETFFDSPKKPTGLKSAFQFFQPQTQRKESDIQELNIISKT